MYRSCVALFAAVSGVFLAAPAVAEVRFEALFYQRNGVTSQASAQLQSEDNHDWALVLDGCVFNILSDRTRYSVEDLMFAGAVREGVGSGLKGSSTTFNLTFDSKAFAAPLPDRKPAGLTTCDPSHRYWLVVAGVPRADRPELIKEGFLAVLTDTSDTDERHFFVWIPVADAVQQVQAAPETSEVSAGIAKAIATE